MHLLRFCVALVLLAACAASEQTPPPGPQVAGASPVLALVELPLALSETNFFDAWGPAPDELYLVGEAGAVVHLRAGVFTIEPTPTAEDLRAVWGDEEAVYAVGLGGTILRRFDETWAVEASGTIADLHAVAGGGAKVFAVGNGGTALLRDEEAGWQPFEADTLESLYGLWVSEDGEAAVAVGGLGTVLRLSGERLRRRRITGLTAPLQAVWGLDAGELFLVGLDGTFLRLEGDAATAIEGAPLVYFRDLWGAAANDLWLVGWGGTVAHFDGETVQALPDVSDHRLESIVGFSLPPSEEGPTAQLFITGVTGRLLAGRPLPPPPPQAEKEAE